EMQAAVPDSQGPVEMRAAVPDSQVQAEMQAAVPDSQGPVEMRAAVSDSQVQVEMHRKRSPQQISSDNRGISSVDLRKNGTPLLARPQMAPVILPIRAKSTDPARDLGMVTKLFCLR
ncbi:MAG TPA: hypothetical protein V6D17_16905, partial [Candidatus Obscuribacterales bacterium]